MATTSTCSADWTTALVMLEVFGEGLGTVCLTAIIEKDVCFRLANSFSSIDDRLYAVSSEAARFEICSS